MNESDARAPLLKHHIIHDKNLGDCAGHPFRAEDLFHLRAEESWADEGGEKHHGAQPNRSVEQTDKSQYRSHGPQTVWKTVRGTSRVLCKLRVRRRWDDLFPEYGDGLKDFAFAF